LSTARYTLVKGCSNPIITVLPPLLSIRREFHLVKQFGTTPGRTIVSGVAEAQEAADGKVACL
jgi:hypothetical protein